MLDIIILLFILIIVIVICLLEYNRRKLLFCGNKKIAWIPTDAKNLFIRRDRNRKVVECNKNDMASINVWDFVSNDNKIILFNHGTNGNISQRKYIYDFCKLFDLNLILYDYPGFGDSAGEPTERNIFTSSMLVMDYIKSKYNNRIILFSESLGGPIGANLAKEYECDCLVLMSTFSSLDDALIYSDIKYINSKIVNILKHLYNTLPTKEIIKSVTCPVIIIHSSEDRLISIDNAKLIYFNCLKAKEKKMIVIKGSHVSPTFNLEQFKSFLDFCNISRDNLNNEQLNYIINSLKDMSKTCFIY
jgi:pimeloyl-ACP methyl ester carboxylesterase